VAGFTSPTSTVTRNERKRQIFNEHFWLLSMLSPPRPVFFIHFGDFAAAAAKIGQSFKFIDQWSKGQEV
jgi:hypothetical protein